MPSHPETFLFDLREIGWSLWDPISLQQIDPAWRSQGGDDEYDSYLLCVVELLRQGKSEADCASYLMNIEILHMGLGSVSKTEKRAIETVQAIKARLMSET